MVCDWRRNPAAQPGGATRRRQYMPSADMGAGLPPGLNEGGIALASAILPCDRPPIRPSSVGLPRAYFEPKFCSISVTGNR